MAKKKLELDDFDLDAELDFGDFGIEDIEDKVNPNVKNSKTRKAVTDTFTGTISGVKDKFKDPSFLAKVAKNSLPDNYGEVFDIANQTAGTVSSLYDETIRELKPQLGAIAKKVDRLVPENQKTLKAITDKLKKLTGADSENTATDKKAIEDQSIANSLAAIFQEQIKANEAVANKSLTDNKVNQALEDKRFRSNFGLLSSMNENITRLTSYTEKVTQGYQKKSLELQFRSYFALTELVSTANRTFETFKAQNDAIVKNTALPEYVKINESERFKELARNKFYSSIQNKLFDDGGILRKGLDKIKSDATDLISGVKAGLENTLFALEGIEQMREAGQMTAEMGISKANLAGNMAGGWIGEKIGSKVSKYLKPRLEKNKKITNTGYKINTAINNMGGTLADLDNNQDLLQAEFSGGAKGAFAKAARYLLSSFMPGKPDMVMSTGRQLGSLGQATMFNNKTQVSITEVIPGYLARIHRELIITRTGNESVGLTTFDHQRGRFTLESTLGADIKASLASKVSSGVMDRKLDELVSSIHGSDLDEKQKYKAKEFYSKISTIPNMSYTPDRIKNTNIFKSLDKSTADLISKGLDSKFADPEDTDKNINQITLGMKGVRDNISDLRGEIQLFIDSGYGEILEQQGLVKTREDGSYVIDDKNYYNFIREHGLISSDVNVKQGIKAANPKSALAAIRKTKLYNWLYKSGKGDKKRHVGPMAQHVKQNMGSGVAPGGTSIDLVNMNGTMMGAIQALSDEQQKSMKSDSAKSILLEIKSDTARLVELIESGALGGGFNTGSLGDFIKSAPGKLYDKASQGIGFINKRVVRPFRILGKKFIRNNGKRAEQAFSFLFDKASTLAGGILDVGTDIITKHIPEGFRNIADFGNKVKDTVSEWLNGPKDLYLKGMKTPAIRARLMRLGHYKDQITGKVIKSIDDLKRVKGNIINQAGEVVVSIEDLAEGLYDQHGEEVKSTLMKAGEFLLGSAAEGFNRGKNFLKSVFDKTGKAGSGIIDRVKGAFGEFGSGGFGGKKIYEVLVEIRDILKGKQSDGTLGGGSTIIEQIGEDEQPQPTTDQPRYTSGGSFFGGLASMAGGIKNRLQSGAAGALEAMRNSGKGKWGKFRAGAKGLFGGMLSGNQSEEQNPEQQNNTPTLMDRAKGFAQDKAEQARTVIKNITNRGPSTFNDRDGSGRRDGSWQDRLEELEKRKQSRKKNGTLLTPADPRYQSGTNVIDTLIQKASGFISSLTSGAGSIFETAGDLLGNAGGIKGIMGKIKGAAKGAWNLLKNPKNLIKGAGNALKSAAAKIGVGKAAGAVAGKAGLFTSLATKAGYAVGAMKAMATTAAAAAPGILTTLGSAAGAAATALGAILTSPVTLTTAAVAVAGYGIYKLYKYANRNEVSELEQIRMLQYGLGHDQSLKSYNHYLLVLEQYLLDGRMDTSGDKPIIKNEKVKEEELLEIFEIDPKDQDAVSNFTHWFVKRFTPFFTHHVSALQSVDSKIQLSDINKLTTEQKLSYLRKAGFESGPYSEGVSPFKDLDYLKNTESITSNFVTALTKKFSEEARSTKQGKVPANIQEYNRQLARDERERVKKHYAGMSEENKEAMRKINDGSELVNSYKATAKNSNSYNPNTGEDGDVKDLIAPKPSKDDKLVPAGSMSSLISAGGPISTGEAGMQYIKFNKPGIRIDGLHPGMRRNFLAMAQEYGELTGKSLLVTSGTRTYEEQARLYRQNPQKAAKPGRSLHEFGLALDLNSPDLDALDKMGLMRKYGFTRPIGGETWHMEPAGIQVDIQRAKKDQNFAAQAIAMSLGKGGGGYGSIKGSTKYKRNTELALKLLNASSKTTNLASDKDKANTILAGNTPVTPIQGSTSSIGSIQDVNTSVPTSLASSGGIGGLMAANNPMSTGNSVPSYDQSDKYSKSEMLPDLESQPSITGSEVTETAGRSGDIKSTIATYARKAGIDPNMATTFAAMESSLNPNAKASTSSAAGPFQFISSTWRSMLSKYGKKYGLDSNASPFDVKASTLMASEFIKENINGLKKVVSNPNIVHAYLAHFLGLGGARTFLKMGPNDIPARTMQAAARANRSVFFDKSGRPRTVAQIYEVMKNKITKAAKDFGISLPSISGTPTASNDSNYSGQGAANDPVASSSSSVSFGDAGSMLGGQPSPTAPSASSSMKGLLSPQNTNPIGTYDGSGIGYSPDSGGSSLDTVATAMNKSVDIQTQMLAVLQEIAGKINPENFNDLKGMIDKAVTGGGMQEVSGKVNQTARSASASFNSIIDLTRKTA